jgi:hypothetical protein
MYHHAHNFGGVLRNCSLDDPVHLVLGGHGGGFTDSNSPEVVRAREQTSGGFKIKTTTAQTRTANPNMMLQLMEGLL